MNVSDEILLNAEKCQGYSFYHFRVNKGKPTGYPPPIPIEVNISLSEAEIEFSTLTFTRFKNIYTPYRLYLPPFY